MMSAAEFVTQSISRWEGKMSRDPNDAGNWSSGKKGVGRLLGSNYGVTGRTLAAYRGVSINTLVMKDIESLTLQTARDVSLKLFYAEPGLDRLPWCRVTASVLDFGWGAGPVTSVKLLQDLLDVSQDGVVGAKETIPAFQRRLVRSEEFFAGAWWAMREEYYEALVERRPSDGIYLKGWDNRSDWFTPGHAEGFWVRFAK